MDLKFVFADFTVDLEVDYADSIFTVDSFPFPRRATVDFKFLRREFGHGGLRTEPAESDGGLKNFTRTVLSRWIRFGSRGE